MRSASTTLVPRGAYRASAHPWNPTLPEQERTYLHAIRVIHRQQIHGRAPLGREPIELAVRAQRKVISPYVTPGVEKRHEDVGERIERGNVGALLQVATRAAQTEVVGVVWAIVLPSDDV